MLFRSQSRENAPWYQHEDMGYNYRMSNVISGVVRGQYPYLQEHLDRKREIYFRYKEGLKDLPISMNPYIEDIMVPNFWLSCILIDESAMCEQDRSDKEATYIVENEKSCPTQILETLSKYNAEGRPIWKPMHMQPVYNINSLITKERCINYTMRSTDEDKIISEDVFNRGLCLPSDIKMTDKEQDIIISIVASCF